MLESCKWDSGAGERARAPVKDFFPPIMCNVNSHDQRIRITIAHDWIRDVKSISLAHGIFGIVVSRA